MTNEVLECDTMVSQAIFPQCRALLLRPGLSILLSNLLRTEIKNVSGAVACRTKVNPSYRGTRLSRAPGCLGNLLDGFLSAPEHDAPVLRLSFSLVNRRERRVRGSAPLADLIGEISHPLASLDIATLQEPELVHRHQHVVE